MTCPPRFKPLLFVSVLHTIPVSMNSKGPGRQKSFTHFEHRAGKVGWERFGALNSSPHPRIFTSLSDGSSPRSYLFTSATGRIGVHTTPKYGKKPIRYVTLYFRDRLGAASLCHRNCATTNVPVCEQKPYTVWFSWRRKSCAVQCEYLKIIPGAGMGYWLRAREGARNYNCVSKIQLVGEKYRDKTTLASKTRFSRHCFGFQSRRFSLPVGYNI